MTGYGRLFGRMRSFSCITWNRHGSKQNHIGRRGPDGFVALGYVKTAVLETGSELFVGVTRDN
ncbi:MAG TPA: hypothetical protein ENK32_06490 [Anaerolineae bacterium]|nr:hypothetical protein [Anaerolineae bacterium]